MPGIDINRTTSGVLLPKEVSAEIWQGAITSSAVMQLATQMQIPGAGMTIPTITGDPTAAWVAETAEKPVSRPTLGQKNIQAYKMAVIEPFSNEFRRDLPSLYSALVSRLPMALAKLFDSTVLFGTAPGSSFDTLTAAPAVSINNVSATATSYDGFLAALSAVTAASADITGWALSAQGEILALSAKDGNGRPIFTDSPANDGSIGRILGRPAAKSQAVFKLGVAGAPGTPSTVGFAGDWSQARYGIVDGISISVTDQATLNDGGTSLNLWQRNMFAVRVEMEVGFVVRTPAAFVRLTGATPTT